ncbi:hypothetical protein [Streptomyces sp. H27-S2]|uniref:hypothetical protein n=1 Tax=Streptomyces antarcticus TaxID=2996458 RepID=UPI00226EC81E|nr:hypothetical protein [Streptomyces sp. H27-S2]MCY0948390.1 hypothetical protein [Streptomyces sp. H27-S2]
MNTFFDYLTVLAIATLLAGPALYGALGDHRTDRQLRTAPRGRPRHPRTVRDARRGPRPAAPRIAVRHAPGR